MSPFRLPDPAALPPPGASLQQVIRFADAHDPTLHFRARWGSAYAGEATALWGACVAAFKAGAPPPGSAEDLLMCLAYDCVLGPYMGVPEPHKAQFLDWLLDGLRQRLEARPQA